MYKNILSNIIGKLWSVISIYLFIPIYLYFLGINQYGLVSFFATLQTIVFLLDAGLSFTLRREFSIGNTDTSFGENKYRLLRSIESAYLLLSILILLFFYVASGSIVDHFLRIGNLNRSIVITVIQLMCVSITVQFFSSLYNGGLIGLEKQVLSNYIQIFYSLIRNGGVVLLLWIFTKDLRGFYLWFIVVDVLYAYVLRKILSGLITYKLNKKLFIIDIKLLKAIWKFSSGIFTISIISAINYQLDSLLVGKYLPISQLGIYNLAFSFSQLPVMILNSVAVAIFPRFVNLYSTGKIEKLNKMFLRVYLVFNIIGITMSIFVFFYSKYLLMFWTKNNVVADMGSPVLSLLILGSLFLTMQIVPYNYLLARGVTKVNLLFGFVNVIVVIPLLLFSIPRYGLMGAAFTWFLILLLITPLYIRYFYRSFFANSFMLWFFKNSILPILLISCIGYFSYLFWGEFGINSDLFAVLYAAIIGILTISLVSIAFFKRESKLLWYRVKKSIMM